MFTRILKQIARSLDKAGIPLRALPSRKGELHYELGR